MKNGRVSFFAVCLPPVILKPLLTLCLPEYTSNRPQTQTKLKKRKHFEYSLQKYVLQCTYIKPNSKRLKSLLQTLGA